MQEADLYRDGEGVRSSGAETIAKARSRHGVLQVAAEKAEEGRWIEVPVPPIARTPLSSDVAVPGVVLVGGEG